MPAKMAMGWERDLPDFRDMTVETPDVHSVRARSKALARAQKKMPARADLRQWCSPVEDQGSLGSCTANAGVALAEYYQLRTRGRHLEGSRLFLYKATRNLLGWSGDTGAYLRTTMKAMALFGVPPEPYWPYEINRFEEEPSAFIYALGQNFQAAKYYRLDPPGQDPALTLRRVKENVAAGLPAMFGFTVYSSIPGVGAGTGDIPFPATTDRVNGGHAVVVVGYDDARDVRGDKGALLIRNSWGDAWGEAGYGWLPYRYVLSGLAVDFWSLISAEYVDLELFE